MTHPFQTESGTSQRQRVMDSLLGGTAKIDGRSLADLLSFFVQLSEHITYYDEQMQVSDWKPFFKQSLPFTVAGIARFDYTASGTQLAAYRKNFLKKPSVAGLQLLLTYINNRLIKPIDQWQDRLKDSGLNIALVLERLIKDKLKPQVYQYNGKNNTTTGFIPDANAATKWYCTTNFDFTYLLKDETGNENKVWELDPVNLYAQDDSFRTGNHTRRKRLMALYEKLYQRATAILDVTRLLTTSATMSLEQSLLPLKEELREKHPPHLAVLFAFLNMFRSLQADLNSFTKKHLDYFYKQVLKLVAKQATPDKVHIIGQIQKQLDKYLLKKGTLLKDGKDINKAEIYFETDGDLVINKTQIADQRTLFLNNINVNPSTTLVEGVYMAPDATKANGIDKDFKDDVLPSRAALGAQWSKYIDPEKKFTYPYPNARIGFVLASPVLLLNEGTRKINITLACSLTDDYCKNLVPQTGTANPCCEPRDNATGTANPVPLATKSTYPLFQDAATLVQSVCNMLNTSFYYITAAKIAAAVKKGISKDLEKKLNGLLTTTSTICYCPADKKAFDRVMTAAAFNTGINADERKTIVDIFYPEKAISVKFSGEKEWIVPTGGVTFTLSNCNNGIQQFNLVIDTTLTPDLPAVTFYNGETLKEDLNTTLPLVKIEFNDHIKLNVPVTANTINNECCEKGSTATSQETSLYHFFRNVHITDAHVTANVCNLRNLIVQNDENVENINSLVRPFGVRPKVGANFYIGSQEIFAKNWQKIWVNAEWKDKPEDLADHYKFYKYEDFEDGTDTITEASFKRTHAVLEDGVWKTSNPANFAGQLFNGPLLPVADRSGCTPAFREADADKDVYRFTRGNFTGSTYSKMDVQGHPLDPLNIKSRYGFLRLTLQGVSFQHDRYAFVVARHMMALAGLIDPLALPKVKDSITESLSIIDLIQLRVNSIRNEAQDADANASTGTTNTGNLGDAASAFGSLHARLNNIQGQVGNNANTNNAINSTRNFVNPNLRNLFVAIDNEVSSILNTLDDDPLFLPFLPPFYSQFSLQTLVTELKKRIEFIEDSIKGDPELLKGLPKEPYTPAIKFLSVDYEATADINDIDLIHLYPYDGTYKAESLTQTPALVPTYCDEGNLFIGLSGLVPGSNVNILFQLAEATADSESEREDISWYYLENNTWKLLRPGFEVLDDDTNGLTTSGIIKFALPANITNENTILPKGKHWIKAGIPRNSRSISEIIALHTQAIKAVFTNTAENDKTRLAAPLAAGSVAKLQTADAAVTKIEQPYESFGGALPEGEGHFYVRVSELLRHKNRAIQKFDYERLALEAFPDLFKVKCINHTYGLSAHDYGKDFTVAPGYVTLAVIPDLNKLKAAQTFEPKAPVSLLEEIKATLQKCTSPFVRLKVMNPRYEKVKFCLRVKLLPGMDESYYKDKLKQDLTEFLAPWAVGQYDKLTFGQPVNFSDIVRFLEGRDYLDYIIDLVMEHEDDPSNFATPAHPEILPLTPRSILVAGDIDICIDQSDCPAWGECGPNVNQPCCEDNNFRVNDKCDKEVPQRETDIKQ